jgi:two-component system, NarL family, sensor histidine kinase UhpB
LTFAQATGDGWKKAIHPDDLSQILAARDRAVADAGELSLEHRLCTPTGDVRWVHSASVPLHAPDGELAGRIGTITDITDRVTAEDRRDRALSKIARGQEEERANLASDLHDDTIQVMTAALIAIDRAAHSSLDKDAQNAVDDARKMLADATERIRRTAFNLRPQLLEAEGLTGAIPALTADTAAEAGLQAKIAVDTGRYSDVVEFLVYGVVRETLTNIRRHAQASHVTVTLGETDGIILGTIEDDGVGFDIETALSQARLTHHLGLDTTIEKLRLAGGELKINSTPGSGTRVRFTTPILP